MKLTKTVTVTEEKVIGFKCDLCGSEYLTGKWGDYHGTVRITLQDGCDGTYSKWSDLCLKCTDKVFKFIKDEGGKVNSDY
jgi:hypothetical protein